MLRSLGPDSLYRSIILTSAKTLALSAILLATKATDSPRRSRHILLPAHQILNPRDPPLTFPSHKYDAIRDTLVQGEIILLRVLQFQIRLLLPYDYLPKMLLKTLGTFDTAQDYNEYTRSECEEHKVVKLKETGLGEAAARLVQKALVDYSVSTLFPMKDIATASLFLAMKERGYMVEGVTTRAVRDKSVEAWLDWLTDGKVPSEEFWEIVRSIENLDRKNTRP